MIPLKNEGANASKPESSSYFYYDSLIKPYKQDQVRLCERSEVPIFQKDFLGRKLDIDLLTKWKRNFPTLQNLSLYAEGNTDVFKFTQNREKNNIS